MVITAQDIFSIIILNSIFLEKEDNVVNIKDPVIFVGDIHGQFYDLNKMFELVKKVGDIKYIL